MKITVLTTSFPLTPASMSGIFIHRLISHFPDTIHTTVITPAANYPVPITDTSLFKLKCFRYGPKSWQVLAHIPGGIIAALTKNKFLFLLLPFFFTSMFFSCFRSARNSDLIYANWSINGIIAGTIGRITSTPVITTLRGSDVNLAQSSKLLQILLTICLRLSDNIVVVSKAISRYITEEFPHYKNKITFIPNGVDDVFLSISKEKTGETLQLLSAGSLTPGKGVDTIIHAVSRLTTSNKFRLTIVGEGDERLTLEKLSESLKVSSHIRFLGKINPDQIPSHMKNADIFLLASHREGRPNIVLEAMAAGVPVIASNIEGVKELIADEKNGLLYPAGDVEKLATLITFLAANPGEREKIGTAAQNFIIDSKLTWNETAKRYTKLFRETVNNINKKVE